MPALDGVRGLAIVLVLFYHMTDPDLTRDLAPWRWVVRNFGWCGVDLFFVLSGYLITGILYDSKGSQRYFRNFYARRVLRIFPLYYGYLLALFVAAPLLYARAWEVIRVGNDAVWYWLYLQNYAVAAAGNWVHSQFLNHLWSLAIEEQFYLVWPLVVLLCSRRGLMAVCLAAVAASFLLRLILLAQGFSPVSVYVLTPTHLDGLALGGLLAMAVRGKRGMGGWAGVGKVSLGLAMAAIAGLAAWQGGFSYMMPGTLAAGLILLAIAFAGLLAWTLGAHTDSPVSRFFCGRALGFFGRYSYALYVFHQPVIAVCSSAVYRLGPSWRPAEMQLALYVTALAGSIAISLASWHLYEKHFLRLKRQFPSGSAGRQLA